MSVSYRPCELCGAPHARLLLRSPRLDGPLVRCPRCELVYVGQRRHDFTFAAADPERTRALGDLVTGLGIVARDVEAREQPWRRQAEAERLERLRRHAGSGRLLDVGCAAGAFLEVAKVAFDAEGVEPDPGTAEQARARGLCVFTGALESLAAAAGSTGSFDVITMFHVIEHLDSPRRALEHAHALLRPGGRLLIETPNVENRWFRIAPGRWRQLIPDHYFFFSPPTLARLLGETGFRPGRPVAVGRAVSLRFAADRLRRAGVPSARPLAGAIDALGVGGHAIRITPGDIMQVVARAL